MENSPPPAVKSDFPEQWRQFRSHFELQESRFISELSGSWTDLMSLFPPDAENWANRVLSLPPDTAYEAYASMRQRAADQLLNSAAGRMLRKGPVLRVLRAQETYDRGVEDALRLLPEVAQFNGRALLPPLRELLGTGPSSVLLRLTFTARPFPIRAAVSAAIQSMSSRRAAIEVRFGDLLLSAMRHVCAPWDMIRDALDAQIAGRTALKTGLVERLSRLRLKRDLLELRAAQVLKERSSWTSAVLPKMARHIALALIRQPSRTSAYARKCEECKAAWSALSRMMGSEWQLNSSLVQCEQEILGSGQQAIKSIAEELRSVVAELQSAIVYLRERSSEDSASSFPSAVTDLVPAASRIAELESGIRASLRLLPDSCEMLPRFRAARKPEVRILNPRETLLQSYTRLGRDTFELAFERARERHSRVIQEIEHARRILIFTDESTASGNIDSASANEAIENARLSLEFQRTRQEEMKLPDTELSIPTARVFIENRFLLGQRRFGAAAHIARYGARRTGSALIVTASAALKYHLGRVLASFKRSYSNLLVSIGLREKPRAGVLEVITRPYLPKEFTADLKSMNLPAIYRHLFRFEPIQDPRFLVDREREMTAISEARDLWIAGRTAAILLSGPRGSGKTSLINCAVKKNLGGIDIIRGEFNRRIVTSAELRRFLSDILGIGGTHNLEEELNGRRRVIIIEELERCFLRKIEGYGAIREMQKIIAASCSTTLWMLSINDIAFQFLDACVNLGHAFSHRINAGTATPGDLKKAILLRHQLSGLRLNFPPVPASKRDRSPFQADGASDPEKYFFGLLARESAGAYRAAFDIWLAHIESVHGGMLYLKAIEIPDLSPMIDHLSQDEIFSLVAINQHGGLTPEEHAQIFQKSPADSRALIDALLSQEIIEPDPGRAGFRIRPEVDRIVRETLYRSNLIGQSQKGGKG